MKEQNKLHFLTKIVMFKSKLERIILLAIASTGMGFLANAQFAGGDGSAGDPYQITTLTQLDSIRNHSGGENYLDDHFILMNDLDFDDGSYTYSNVNRGWTPLGHDTNNGNTSFNGTRFTGSFNGKGYAIRNLYISRAESDTPRDYLGLFGALEGSAKIDSVGLEAVNITGRRYVGGLVGLVGGSATIQHNYVTGNIEGTGNYVGGMTGRVGASATLQESYAATQVTGNDNVGGLVGESVGTISNSYALGQVNGAERVGGLVGRTTGTVSTCYAVAQVEGTSDVGGLIGLDNSGTYTHNYWNTTISELTRGVGNDTSDPTGITGLTTDQMYVESNFDGFSFSGPRIWRDPDADQTRFPRLINIQHNGQVLFFPEIPPKAKDVPFTLAYEIFPNTLESADIVFESSDETIATVDNTGVVTPIKLGEVTLTISRGGGTNPYAPVTSLSRNLFVVPFDGGSGTETDPFQISTPAQLDSIRRRGDGIFNLLDDHYVLTQDLDFSDYEYEDEDEGWLPIGHKLGMLFTGGFNGKGFAIRHLRINRPDHDNVGLFGLVSGTTSIDSLAVEYANFIGRDVVGGLAGEIADNVTISRSYASGQIQGRDFVGGIVGEMAGTVEESHASTSVRGVNVVGGLAGRMTLLSTLTNSYATGLTAGEDDVGGIVGRNASANVVDNYAAVRVEGATDAGGFVGHDNSGGYATNYWNTAISGQARSAGNGGNDPTGITPLTTEEMYMEGSFTGFDFGNSHPWKPPTANQFPQLRRVTKNAQAIDLPTPALVKAGSDPYPLTYTAIPANPDGVSISFESADETIATINANGEVTPKKAGTTMLTIHRTGNNDYTHLVSVTRKLVVHPFEGGAGTETNPYQIATPEQLDFIRDHGVHNLLDDHYALTQDIDFADYAYQDNDKGWQPLGHDIIDGDIGFDGKLFTGGFNGKGFAIQHLRINRPDQEYVGLFGRIGGTTTVDSLGIEEVDITGQKYVGSVAGHVESDVSLYHNYASGKIRGDDVVGGLVGSLDGTIEESHASISVSGEDDVGGLVGWMGLGTLTNNYATGWVIGDDDVGGLIGYNASPKVTDNYAAARVEGTTNAGGFVGNDNSSGYTTNYYNTAISGLAQGAGNKDDNPAGITGLTTAQMHMQGSFTGFDFGNTDPWRPPTANTFPQLRGVTKNAQVVDFPPLSQRKAGSDPFALTYTLFPSDLPGTSLTFESADETVATVANNGMVTPQGAGATDITIHRTGNDDYTPLVSVSRKLLVHPFEGGTGTEADPYQIATPAQLDGIRDNFLANHYVLTQDLDFSDHPYADPDKGWLPMGHSMPFTGTFHGKGSVIRNLFINRPSEDHIGLFGATAGQVTIDSLGIDSIKVVGGSDVGGLIGLVGFGGSINDCYVMGNIMGRGDTGGLIGHFNSADTINRSYAIGQVTGVASFIGGLVGQNVGVINTSYASVQVTGFAAVGGLVGYNANGVRNSYATGQVKGFREVGGLIGWNGAVTMSSLNSYAVGLVEGEEDVGGFIGNNTGSANFVANYWNTATSGQASSAGEATGKLEGLSTAEMYMQGSFDSWDFTDIWSPPTDGEHFPQLRGVSRNAQVLNFEPVQVKAPDDAAFTVSYTLLPPTLSGIDVVLESSDEAVATLDASGEVTIQGAGATTLTIRRAGNDDYAPVSASQVLIVNPFEGAQAPKPTPTK